MELNLKGRAISYSEPALFLLMALYGQMETNRPSNLSTKADAGAILAVFDLSFKQRRPQDLLNLSKFADHAFGTFWLMVGKELKDPTPSNIEVSDRITHL